jgi:hypothetical protein
MDGRQQRPKKKALRAQFTHARTHARRIPGIRSAEKPNWSSRRVTSSHVESRRVRKGFTLYVTDHRIALRLRKGVKSLRKGVKVLRRASVKVLRKGVKAGAQGPARSAVGPPRAPGRVT